MELHNYPILLVEDNPTDNLLTKKALHAAKLLNPVMEVADGEIAMAYLSGEPPYDNRKNYPLPVLVLLDLQLPGKSGLEVLAWVRQQLHFKDLPVIVLTGSKHITDVNRAYDLGINAYLVKPVSFDALLKSMKYINQYWVILNKNTQEPQGS